MFMNLGGMKLRHKLDGHKGWITCLEMTDTMVISGSKESVTSIYKYSTISYIFVVKYINLVRFSEYWSFLA